MESAISLSRRQRCASAGVITTFGAVGQAVAQTVTVQFSGYVAPTDFDLTNVRLTWGSNFSVTPEYMFTLPDASAGATTHYSFQFQIDSSLFNSTFNSWEITGVADVGGTTGNTLANGFTHTINNSFGTTISGGATHTTDHYTYFHGIYNASAQSGAPFYGNLSTGSATDTSVLQNWFIHHPYHRYPVEWDVAAGLNPPVLETDDFDNGGRYGPSIQDVSFDSGTTQTLISFVDSSVSLSNYDKDNSPDGVGDEDFTDDSFNLPVAIAQTNGSAYFEYSVVPEPSLAALWMGLGVFMFAGWRRRRWRKARA